MFQNAVRRQFRFSRVLNRHSPIPIPVQARQIATFRKEYEAHVAERAAEGVPPTPLTATQTKRVCELLTEKTGEDAAWLKELLTTRVPAGVDDAAKEKAFFLDQVSKGKASCSVISKAEATEYLGTMLGGFNVQCLIDALDDAELAPIAQKALSHTLLVFDAFHDVEEKAKNGNTFAQAIMESWAEAEWFHAKPPVPEKITVTVFKVTGETNTDDLSPAPDAWSRPDIPLHANAMLKNERDGIHNAKQQIAELAEKGHQIAYVGDVVGTGSSRKSATNSVMWFMGDEIPFIPNKKQGGVCIGGVIAPIFFNTMEDSGCLPIEMDVQNMAMGDVIDIFPYQGKVCKHGTDDVITNFELKTEVLLDEVQAGGRIPLIIGRGLTRRARESLGKPPSEVFRLPAGAGQTADGYTLAQKIVGRACGEDGILPGTYCEPAMGTVGSQDTTGPMTRDELKDLACLGFSADLVMQSFCHTAAYPKPVDVITHNTLPDFMHDRGGVALRPGDGIIHSWLNRMLLPDQVGTGGDSHTRFPLGISFPAGSGLVAFAAATGVMPLDMPESVLVRFHGKMQPGITLRDLVHAIPYYAIQQGLLTVEKKGKKNVFSGKVLEIEGLPELTVEQAFELSDASAERSAAGCSIDLNRDSVEEYLSSNITMLKWMISEGYNDERTLRRRIGKMEEFLKEGTPLLKADKGAKYHTVIEIDLADVKEPVLCCPNDPDDAKLLSDVAGTKIDEVFIGSCMTNIGHFRAAAEVLKTMPAGSAVPTRLWIAPPTKMDEAQLIQEGHYSTFGTAGARLEMPGCSLCMGNQARIAEKSTAVSTSTRNFPNRLGKGTNVFLSSAEVAAVSSILGKLPTPAEYMEYAQKFDTNKSSIYRYLNFHQMENFQKAAGSV
ncbi:unnamed protein product [Amoebophrya sp. A120]|nr:unnamed protein product [Amoebophrya sp. A120]|eukprot:GSA120T00001440001.1